MNRSIKGNGRTMSAVTLHGVRIRYVVTGLTLAVCGFILFVTGLVFFAIVPSPMMDWQLVYRPAICKMLNGENPYILPAMQFYNPPWVLVLMAPFSLLPLPYDIALIWTVGLAAFLYIAYRMGASPLNIILFMTSVPVIRCMAYGQIDWLALMGLFLPLPVGLFLLVIKPQVGLAIVAYRLVREVRQRGLARVITALLPVTLALLLSFAIYGLWPLNWIDLARAERTDASFWPWSIVFGFAGLVFALARDDERWAIRAAPCFSEHVWIHSWAGPLATLLDRPWWQIAVLWAGLWIWEWVV